MLHFTAQLTQVRDRIVHLVGVNVKHIMNASLTSQKPWQMESENS